MKLICNHDPSDPNHLICEAKYSRFNNWIRDRWNQFYCKGPSCPPHKAYLHLAVDLVLLIVLIGLVGSNLWFFFENRGVQQRKETLEEKVAKISAGGYIPETPSPVIEESSLFIQAEALYFSKEGEQLGRGQWPLKAGETTKLKVFWAIHGADSVDFASVVASGRLGPNVEWTGFAPVGKGLSYDPQSRNARWVVGGDKSAIFEIAVTPTEAQIQDKRILIVGDLALETKRKTSDQLKTILSPNVLLDF